MPNVELRFNDAQALLSSARAQAILYQALLLKARRLARNGSRVGHFHQVLLERNRARAVANGLQARFEVEAERRQPGTHAPKEHYQSGAIKTVSADAVLLELLESLRIELQVLEVEYREIAPLVLGSSLRQYGLAGLRTESDFFRIACKQASAEGQQLAKRIGSIFLASHTHQGDPLSRWNEECFSQVAGLIRRSWTSYLRYTPTEDKNGKRHSEKQPMKPDSRPRQTNQSTSLASATAAPARGASKCSATSRRHLSVLVAWKPTYRMEGRSI